MTGTNDSDPGNLNDETWLKQELAEKWVEVPAYALKAVLDEADAEFFNRFPNEPPNETYEKAARILRRCLP